MLKTQHRGVVATDNMHIEVTKDVAAEFFEWTFVHPDESGSHTRRLGDVILDGTGLNHRERCVTFEFETWWTRVHDELLEMPPVSAMSQRMRGTSDGGQQSALAEAIKECRSLGDQRRRTHLGKCLAS